MRHIGVFPNRPDQIAKLVERIRKTRAALELLLRGRSHAAMASTGNSVTWATSAWWWRRSLIPVKAGDRVKTDRRDAIMLAKPHRPAS